MAAVKKVRKILYFVSGCAPTEKERECAMRCGTQMFRNVQAITSFDFVEECDGVAGAVPEAYAKFPRVDMPEQPKPVPAPVPVVTAPPPPPPPAVTTPPVPDTGIAKLPWDKS